MQIQHSAVRSGSVPESKVDSLIIPDILFIEEVYPMREVDNAYRGYLEMGQFSGNQDSI